jgi:hypothetical protein
MPAIRGAAALELITAVHDLAPDGAAPPALVLTEAGPRMADTGPSLQELRLRFQNCVASAMYASSTCVHVAVV